MSLFMHIIMNRSERLLSDASRILENNILKFWLELDDHRGGFYGRVDGDGHVDMDADRGAIMYARIIWAFSAAYARTRRRDYLLAASNAKEYFLNHFIDHKYGGVYWTVNCNGERVNTRLQLYAQGFGIYALSEFYAATRDEEALKAAIGIYKVVEGNFYDNRHGGYIEALNRDFSPIVDMRLSEHDINAQKTMNSHLHLLEGYANLYRVWQEEKLRGRVVELLDIMQKKIMNPQTGHLELYFDKDWKVIPGSLSYGHDIETSWLALECAFAIKDLDIINKVKPMCEKLYDAGMEGFHSDGSMQYETHPDGSVDDSRQWWVQAEALVGNLWAWKYLGRTEAADAALKTLDYISTYLIDWDGGEWWWSVDEKGIANTRDDKAGEWKCPYHNSRMCLQILSIFE